MPRRLWLSAGLLATGAVLLAAARLAGAAPPTSDVFRIGFAGASVQIDPQVSDISTGWWLEYATAAKLYNWTDRGSRLVPEVASRVAISRSGRTYTFFLRKGFRFSDGTPVTARNFAYAIDRVANHDLQSPGASFITDPNGTNIVGAGAVLSGQGTHVRGVVVKSRYKLVIHLTEADGAFLLKLTMPFFQATSTTLPLTHEVVGSYPSAGPYAFTRNDVNAVTSIRRNRYYGRGPGRMRPHHVAGLDVQWEANQEDAFQQALANQLDEAWVPAANAQVAANRFGVNRTRFWTKAMSCTGMLLFNTAIGLLHDNVAMRKAISWAVDRTDYVAEAGPYAGAPWTHLLPPGFPGSVTAKKLQPYAATSRIEKARKLAAGHFGDGRVVIAYRTVSAGRAQADIVRRDLVRLGFDPAKVEEVGYLSTDGIPQNWTIAANLGWCSDVLDPGGFFSVFGGLSGTFRTKLERAEQLSGSRRLKAFGKLDLEITNKVAPYAAMRTYNNRYLFSNRVDPRSLSFSGVYQDWSIPALRLK